MNFTQKTEQEIADSKLWKKGEYAFEVMDGDDKRKLQGRLIPSSMSATRRHSRNGRGSGLLAHGQDL